MMSGDSDMSLLFYLIDRGWRVEDILALEPYEAAIYQAAKLVSFELMERRLC